MENKIMLVTYPDSLGKNLVDLDMVLARFFSDAIASIHILPFFPSSGDRGFAPLCYDKIEEPFGTWDDISKLAERYKLMFDYMINHISAQSEYYQDFLQKKDDSAYADLFIRYKDFWENGEPTPEQVDKIYKRKPRAPYITARFADGSEEKVWCTFSEEQVDLHVESAKGREFLEWNLRSLAKRGAAMIRMDAFAYAIKRPDTSCFFIEPENWNLLENCATFLKEENCEILPEIHEHYSIQQRIADHGYYVYDFALPMLVLHALYFGETRYLSHWLETCPRKQFTTLDTHDGIGVVDVKDLLPDAEIERTKEHLFRYGANAKKIYNTEAYNNLDVYQLNCTYYSALGDNDDAYLLARAIQFFAPGIPQVYYVGLLAGKNDLELLESTKEGRNINRHYYSIDEIASDVETPVVKKLLALMRFRNECDLFDGECYLSTPQEGILIQGWKKGDRRVELSADLAKHQFTITQFNGETSNVITLD